MWDPYMDVLLWTVTHYMNVIHIYSESVGAGE